VNVIYKSGDDLRQDMLTLQMIRIMDGIWQSNQLELCMQPYGCISTGDGVGLIEVVLNAETVSKIQLEFGGSSAAFKDQPIAAWLRKQNPIDAEYDKAVDVFTRSCAGYCVATYVWGIGDRHNDNIMVSRKGHLFHIDFGHFLGNIKRKFGFRRERAPFVLTPDFVYVMGKEGMGSVQFKRFVDFSVSAYLVLRKHASLFINLFTMVRRLYVHLLKIRCCRQESQS
jgi:phosphatidylinositol-4,5-bisphosphate 3-kinase